MTLSQYMETKYFPISSYSSKSLDIINLLYKLLSCGHILDFKIKKIKASVSIYSKSFHTCMPVSVRSFICFCIGSIAHKKETHNNEKKITNFLVNQRSLSSSSSSSSTNHAASMDFPVSLSLHSSLSIIAAGMTSRFHPLSVQSKSSSTVKSRWSANISTSMCRGPCVNIAFEFVLTPPAVFRMSCSSYLDGFRVRR